MIELHESNGKRVQRLVRIGLQCGFNKMWLGTGKSCALIDVHKENETAIMDQLQRNTQLNLSGKLLSTNKFKL